MNISYVFTISASGSNMIPITKTAWELDEERSKLLARLAHQSWGPDIGSLTNVNTYYIILYHIMSYYTLFLVFDVITCNCAINRHTSISLDIVCVTSSDIVWLYNIFWHHIKFYVYMSHMEYYFENFEALTKTCSGNSWAASHTAVFHRATGNRYIMVQQSWIPGKGSN